MTRNHASGGESVSKPRSQPCRQRTADARRATPEPDGRGVPDPGPDPGRFCRSATADNSPARHPMIWVQAATHFWNGTQSLCPLPHWASGVFQNLSVLKYASGAFA